MVHRVVCHLVDDLDGSDISDGAGESVEFTVRGLTYQIDLSAANVAKFDEALMPFMEAASSVRRGRAVVVPAGSATAHREHHAVIRDWARQHGFTTGGRGRIRADVVDAFVAAH